MFLIEFSEGQFIDGERVTYISVGNEQVTFALHGEGDGVYAVGKGEEEVFLNHMQSLNKNITSISARYEHMNNPDTKY
tara:strand:+ start:219 stop:452 length:234 start_codon:yes stop_codon:yes gene_type:complete